MSKPTASIPDLPEETTNEQIISTVLSPILDWILKPYNMYILLALHDHESNKVSSSKKGKFI